MQQGDSQSLLGYQVRLPIDRLPALWTPKRREEYLLLANTKAPLSADPRVWPAAGDPDLADRLFLDFERGPYHAPNGLSLFHLRESVIDDPTILAAGGHCLVAIGAERDVATRLRNKHSIIASRDEDVRGKRALYLLGFDVCDEWLLSGLMNCGLGPHDHASLRLKYSGLLNHHGLFRSSDNASEYASELNDLVPEHVPFLAFSLFTLDNVDAMKGAD